MPRPRLEHDDPDAAPSELEGEDAAGRTRPDNANVRIYGERLAYEPLTNSRANHVNASVLLMASADGYLSGPV
jgi:hypothetical protein